MLLSVLAGQKRYADITARSEDSVWRAFTHASEEELTAGMDKHLDASFAPLLAEQWILDVDATVKPLYRHQEDARAGYNHYNRYNPAKPGRPSHACQAMFIASLRMVLNVDVTAGDRTAPCYAQAGLWGWLDARERKDRLHDTGSEAQPTDGADRGADLQLVELVLALGTAGQARRSYDLAPAVSSWGGAQDRAWRTDQTHDHE